MLFVQTSFRIPGGGTGVAAWMLQALAGRCDLTVLSLDPADVPALNLAWGTELDRRDFVEVRPASLGWRLLDRFPLRLGMLKQLLLYRRARALAPRFDVVIGAKDEADLGTSPSLQYIHFPWTWLPSPAADPESYLGLRFPWERWLRVALYHQACVWVSGFSMRRMRRQTTLANSSWTAEHYRRRHGVAAELLRPPVAGTFPAVAWTHREDSFLAIGRLSPEKRLDTIVAILAAVRARGGRDVRLTLACLAGPPAYGRVLRRLAAENASWLTLKADVSRRDLLPLIARHRYGIHANPREPFGMAVAEMVAGGCLVFAPKTGGAAEILGGEERLCFDTPDDAVEKICRLMDDPAAQAHLRDRLAATCRDLALGSDTFIQRIRQLAGVP